MASRVLRVALLSPGSLGKRTWYSTYVCAGVCCRGAVQQGGSEDAAMVAKQRARVAESELDATRSELADVRAQLQVIAAAASLACGVVRGLPLASWTTPAQLQPDFV